MKEELITYKTAKLAKEKGFDSETCLTWYSEGKGNETRLKDIDEGEVLLNYPEESFESDDLLSKIMGPTQEFALLAPTQSLLQKWLREECNIHVETFFDKTYSATITKNGKWYNSAIDYNTYEKALEKGLQEALKLIKI